MKLNRTGNPLDRETRNKDNENWAIIESGFKDLGNDINRIDGRVDNFVEEVSNEALGKVIDNAKLNWKEPVNSFSDLPSDAEEGDTRMVRYIDENKDVSGKVYRYDGTNWLEIQQIDAGPVNELDSRLTSQLADKADLVDVNVLDVDYGEIELPSDFPHTLPFEVFLVDEDTIEHSFDINSYKSGAGEVYLDATASPSQDGLTPQTAQKHFKYALDVAQSLPQETVIIYVMNKYYPRNYFATSSTETINKNIIIAPYQRDHSFIGSFEDPSLLSWTQDGKAYKTTRTATRFVLDLAVKFKGNEPTRYKKVDSVQEVQSKEGTFYFDGTNVWVRRIGDKEPDDDLMVMISIGGPSFAINDKKLVFDRVSWFWHHESSSADSLKVTGNINSELVLYKSSFAYAAANGLATYRVGKVYNVECLAYNNMADGFNYHGTTPMSESPYEFVYEFGIEAFDNGFNGLDNNNGSTAHEGLSILRVNTLTYRSEGPIVADVNGCYSILINCVSHSSTRNVSSRLKAAFFFNNTSAAKPGKAVLINCGGGGKDTYAVATDSNFDIQVRRFKGSNWWPETLDSVKFI